MDRHWGPWEVETLIETQQEFKEVWKRTMIMDYAHGGRIGIDGSKKQTWLRFVESFLNWGSARDHCSQLGGYLFSDIDGSPTQLEALMERTGSRFHHLTKNIKNHSKMLTRKTKSFVNKFGNLGTILRFLLGFCRSGQDQQETLRILSRRPICQTLVS